MRSKLLNADPPVTYAVVLDTGDEAMNSLTNSCESRRSRPHLLLRSAPSAVPH